MTKKIVNLTFFGITKDLNLVETIVDDLLSG